VRHFRFHYPTFGGVVLLIESKLTPPIGNCAHDAADIGVPDQSGHLLGGASFFARVL